jgi:hypothetical protein
MWVAPYSSIPHTHGFSDHHRWKSSLVCVLVRRYLDRTTQTLIDVHSISATMISRLMLNLHDASNRQIDFQPLSVELEPIRFRDGDRL